MQVTFLLGPAGSGKTYRCLSEIRTALNESSEESSPVLVVPKRASFQLKCQLPADERCPHCCFFVRKKCIRSLAELVTKNSKIFRASTTLVAIVCQSMRLVDQ